MSCLVQEGVHCGKDVMAPLICVQLIHELPCCKEVTRNKVVTLLVVICASLETVYFVVQISRVQLIKLISGCVIALCS
jgi:hypothetical protein